MVNVSESLSRGAVSWNDLRWIRECWSGPMVVKGVLIADDARRAVDEGASAIVVSNHGGRQPDFRFTHNTRASGNSFGGGPSNRGAYGWRRAPRQ